MNVCTVNTIVNMERRICIGFFLVFLALASQCAVIQGNIVRNLLDAASNNESTRVNIYNQILKEEVKNEEKIFGTFKNELEDTKRANLRRKAERIFKRQASLGVPLNNPRDNIKDVFGTLENELGDLQRANGGTESVFKREAQIDASDNVKDVRNKVNSLEIPRCNAYNHGIQKTAALLLPVISSLRKTKVTQKKAHKGEIATQKKAHEGEIATQKEAHEREIATQKKAHEREIATQKKAHERELKPLAKYAKDRHCAMKLWSFIGAIRLLNVDCYKDDEREQNLLNSKLATVWKNRETTLRFLLVSLAYAMKSLQNDPTDEIVKEAKANFTTAVDKLHKLDISLPDKSTFFRSQLINEMAFLNKKENSDWEVWRKEHEEFWLEKSNMWKSEEDLSNDPYDVLAIRMLAGNVTIEKQPTILNFIASDKEYAYLEAIVQAYVEDIKMTNQAKLCLWLVTVHPNCYFTNVVEKVSKNSDIWKEFDDVKKRIKFCSALGKFYNTLPVLDPRRDAPPLPDTCEMGSEDYEKYIYTLTNGSPDLNVVGEALISFPRPL